MKEQLSSVRMSVVPEMMPRMKIFVRQMFAFSPNGQPFCHREQTLSLWDAKTGAVSVTGRGRCRCYKSSHFTRRPALCGRKFGPKDISRSGHPGLDLIA